MNEQARDFEYSTIGRAKYFDALCDDFETQCSAGNRPSIESFLLRVDGPDKQPLLVELIAIEMHYRRRNGESIALSEYQTRFPGLSVSRLEETILHSEKAHSPKTSAADQPTIDTRQSQTAKGENKFVKYFGDYELLDVIARGGMGIVYKARQVSLNRIVALKMILSGEFASNEEVERFYTEAKAAALLDHPGIVPIYEVGEHEGKHFFSMTYVEGSSLAAKLNDGPLEPMRAASTMLEVSQAVHYAHKQGVIHRDLKPSNILLDMQGRSRVTDFGLAKRLSEDTGITVSGQVLGTPSYMPPEQAAGQINTIGPASDVYALGAVLYSLTTGRPPFQSASSIDTLRQVVEKEPVAPRQLNSAIPRDLETIILKCLEKSLPRRYKTAKELVEELQRFVEGRPIVARPISRVSKAWRWCRRQPAIAMLLAAVLLSLLSGIGVSSYFALIAQAKASSEAIARTNETNERKEAQKQAELARKAAEVAITQTAMAEEARIAEARQTQIAKDKSSELRRSLYLSDMKQLATLKSEGKIPRIRELLRRQIPDAEEEDLRSFDWNYWHRQVNPPTVVFDLKQPIEVMVASSDERLVALGCTGGKAYIFDVSAGKLLDEVYEIIESHWSSIAFSDSDRRLFGFGKTGTFSVWDRDSKTLVESNNYTDTTGLGKVTTFSPRIPAAVSPDGLWMLAGDPVSQYSNGQCLSLWQTQKFTVSAVPMLNDGEQISVSIGPNGDLFRRRYEFEHRIPGDLLSQHFYCFPKNFKFGSYLVSQEIEEMGKFAAKEYEPCQIVDQDALRLNYESSLYVGGAAINPPQDQWGSPVFGVQFSPDSSRLAAAKRDGKILLSSVSEIIDPQKWTRLTSIEVSAHRGTARQLSYSPNGNLLLSVGDDGKWLVINSTTGEEVFSGGRGVKPLWYCHWLTNKQFMVGTQDGSFDIWDIYSKSPLKSISFEPEAMSAQAILRRKDLAIFGGKSGKIHLWELKGEADYFLPTDNWSTFDIAISKSGRYLAAKSTDDHWYLGDCQSSPMYLEHFSAYHEPTGVFFSLPGTQYSFTIPQGHKDDSTVPDANIQGPRAFFSPLREELLQLTTEGIHVWQMETRQLLKKWDNLGNVDSIQLNLGGYNWDESTRTLSPTPFLVKEKQSFVKYADLSPDGRRLILFSISSSKQRVRVSVFDLGQGTNTHCIELNGDGLSDDMFCRFVSNSKAIISAKGTMAPMVAIWDLENNSLTAANKQLVANLTLNADTQALAVSPAGNSCCVWGRNTSGDSFWRFVDSSTMEMREEIIDTNYQCIRAFVGSDQSPFALLRSTENDELGKTQPLIWASLDRKSSKWAQACVLEKSRDIGRVYQTQWDEQNGRIYLFDNAHRGCIRCWDISNGTEVSSIPIKLQTVDCVGIKNNGEEIAFIATRANEPSTGVGFNTLQTRVRGQFSNVDLTNDPLLATGFLAHLPDMDGWLSLFGFSTKKSTTNNRETWVQKIQLGSIRSRTVVSRDLSRIAQADPLGRVSIWKQLVSNDRASKPTYVKKRLLNDVSRCTTQPFIAISDTGECLAVASGALIAFRNVALDEWQHTPLPSSVSSLAWSRNSQKVAIGFADGSVGVFDADKNQFKPFGTAHRGSVTTITWMPDGKTFASGGEDGAIEIWDAQQRETRIRILTHRGKVNSLEMSDDGSLLVSGGEDGFVRLHRATLPSNEIPSSTELSMPTSEPVSKPVDLTPEQHRTVAAIEWLQDARLNVQSGFGAFGTRLGLDQVALYQSRQLNLRSVHITEESTVADNDLERFSKLSTLKEFVCTKKTMTTNGLAKLSGLVNLERLDLSGIRLDGFDLLSLGISKSLVQLKLGGTGLTDQQLQSVIINCPRLVELNLSDTAISNVGVEAISQLTELRILGLRSTRIDDRCIDAIGRLSNLSVLDLSSTQMKAGTIISGLGELEQLSTLGMTNLGCTDLDLEPLVSPDVELPKGKWKRLTHLDLRNNPISLDTIFKLYSVRNGRFSPVVHATVPPNEPEDLVSLFELGGWRRDTMLRIGKQEMRFADILEPLRRGEHVTALTWPLPVFSRPVSTQLQSSGFFITPNDKRRSFFDLMKLRSNNEDDSGNSELLRSFTQLTELRMDCQGIRFEAYLPQLERLSQIGVLVIEKWRSKAQSSWGNWPIQEIPFGLLSKSANIKKLIIRPENGLTPKELKELSSLPQLEFLDFDIPKLRNSSLNNGALAQLADAIPDLRGLRMHNEWITNKELAHAVSKFQRLQKLELVGAKLTIECLPSLSQMQSLKELTLLRCSLSSKDLPTISSALPGCRVTIDDQMAFLPKIGNLAQLSEANTSPAIANKIVEKHRLAGTVSLPNGSPASNATVTLLQFAQGVRTNSKVATTDAIGTYVFDGVGTGKYTLWAEWNELTSLEERRLGPTLELSQTQDAEKSFDLSLHEGCRYAITVLDKSTRQPIANAKITDIEGGINRNCSTNQSGFGEIAGLPSNEWLFAFKAETYAHSIRTLPKQPLGSRTDVVIELEPGSTLTGTIRDKEGKGVQKAKVSTFEVLAYGGSRRLDRTETDQEGKFELNLVPWGTEFKLQVDSENYVRLDQRLTIPLDVKSLNVDLVVTRAAYGGDCIVYVVNESGSPIAGASIENKGNLGERKGETDQQGMLRLENLLTGFRGKSAIVKAAGYIAQQVPLIAGKKEKPGEVTVKLVKGQSIRGRLLKPNGEPAPFVGVFHRHDDPYFGGDLGGRDHTDQNGRFQFDGLPSRSLFSFGPPKPFAPISSRVLPVGGSDEVTVTLAYEGVIRIRALDEETKKAIPEFNVKVAFSSDKRPNDPTIGGLQMNLMNPGISIGGNLKEFRLGQLTAGWPAQITVSAKGYFKKVLRRVEATLENDSDVINVELTPEDDSMFRTVSGVIIDSSGKPVAGANVRLLVFKEVDAKQIMPLRHWSKIDWPPIQEDPDCLQYLKTTTNQDGSFKLERVQIGDTVEIFHFGGQAANGRKILCDRKSLPSLEGLVIKAPLAGSIKVVVDREKYANAYSVTVSSNDWYATVGTTTKLLDGKKTNVVFDRLPPGLYRVSLQERTEQSKNRLIPSQTDPSEKADVVEKEEELVEFK